MLESNEKFKGLFKKIDECTLCKYSELSVNKLSEDEKTGKLLLSNYGNPTSRIKILFIGIAPSYRRFDSRRRALTPSSTSENSTGSFFFKALKESKLTDYNLFFTNLIKCSTDSNEFPNSYSISVCFNHLMNEILFVKPDLCVCLSKKVEEEIVKRYHKDNLLFSYNTGWQTIRHPSYYFRIKNMNGLISELKDIYSMVKK